MHTETMFPNTEHFHALPLIEPPNSYKLTFEELYRKYYNRVYSICLRMTHNTANAEDLTQDTLIHAYKKLALFRERAAFSSWLHRVTVNQVLMYFRKPVTRYESTFESDELPEQVKLIADNKALPVLEHILLTDAIKKLPPGYRRVFILHDVEGYEHNEIANKLKISIGTSKSQLHKARIKLREIISEKY